MQWLRMVIRRLTFASASLILLGIILATADPLCGGPLTHLQVWIRQAILVGTKGSGRGIPALPRHLFHQPRVAWHDLLFSSLAHLPRPSVRLGAACDRRLAGVELGAL